LVLNLIAREEKMRLSAFAKVLVFFFCFCCAAASAAELEPLVAEMIAAYSKSSKGVRDETFIARVADIDEHLRLTLERDHELSAFVELIDTAQKFNSRKSARRMFEVVLEKAFKRLQFTRVQQDFAVSEEMQEEIEQQIYRIEKYLDPSLPDLDTVDRNSLESRRKRLLKKIKKAYSAKGSKVKEDERLKIEVVDREGSLTQLSPGREANLLAKLKTLIPECAKMAINSTFPHDISY
jgi:hypothetical protein